MLVEARLPRSFRFIVEAECARADVISVRATQIRGFIAFADGRYPEALDLFRRAHYAYALCRGRDIDLATQILLQISALEQTLRSAVVPGSHASPGGRTIAGSAWGPAVSTPTRLLLCYNDAWLHAHDGDQRNAFRKVREAEDLAETPAWRVWALAGRAIIATVFNERAAGREFAEQARELSRGISVPEWDSEHVARLPLAGPSAAKDAAPCIVVVRSDRYGDGACVMCISITHHTVVEPIRDGSNLRDNDLAAAVLIFDPCPGPGTDDDGTVKDA